MAGTVAGILLFGNHAGRPTSGLMAGTLYACTTHGLIYQTTDAGSTWVTWATLGTVPGFGTSGDIAASAPGNTVLAGATGLIADAGHRHARESYATLTAGLDYGESGDISATAYGDTAAAGATGEVADAGHRHPRLGDTADIAFVIDGGGVAITTGVKGDLAVDFPCTITQVTLLADQSGSIVVDIWKDTYANYPPTVADTITAAAKPTISTATKSKDSTLTGWTTTVAAGDTLRFNVDSITTCTRVLVLLRVTRTA